MGVPQPAKIVPNNLKYYMFLIACRGQTPIPPHKCSFCLAVQGLLSIPQLTQSFIIKCVALMV